MKKQITFISLSVALIMLNASCSLEKTDSENEDLKVNNSTLRKSDLGFKEGRIEDYFYNFENNVEASFFRYNPNLMANYSSYADYYSLFNEDPTTMTYRTFPDYLVAMTPVDESEYTVRNIIDSLTVLDSVVLDSVQISSTPFKNLESLEWNLDAEPSLQRYKLVNSDWVIDDTTVRYQDVFDVSAYWAVVDTPFIQNGLLFVDSSEWNDTNYVFLAEDQIVFENSFEFTKKQLSQDSLVFRINTDCNDNGTYMLQNLLFKITTLMVSTKFYMNFLIIITMAYMILEMKVYRIIMRMAQSQLPMNLLTKGMKFGIQVSLFMILILLVPMI